MSDKFNSGRGVRSKQHFQINGRGLDGWVASDYATLKNNSIPSKIFYKDSIHSYQEIECISETLYTIRILFLLGFVF